MEKADGTHTVMRICTSWATTDEQVEELIALL
jgi:threonine aldolase